MKTIKPQVGDIWEVRIPGKAKKVKEIGGLDHRWILLLNGKREKRSAVQWRRQPKGRYTGIWLDKLLEYGKRISTKAERDSKREARWREIALQKGRHANR